MPLGLPAGVRGCLFDMDGVLTRTASVHAAAWKETFDEFLAQWSRVTGRRYEPFDAVKDYDLYVDGRSRADGTRTFLESRGVHLDEGSAEDPETAATIHGISNRKNEILLRKLEEGGVEVFPDALSYLKKVAAAGLPRAVVSASANTAKVLESAGISHLFDARIDGLVAESQHLHGKPAPDTFLAGARALGIRPEEAAVFEDSLAGVEAGRAGGFGLVVGVDRVGQAQALKEHGADVVVRDLTELLESSFS